MSKTKPNPRAEPAAGSAPGPAAPADSLSPADRYQELFVDIQMARVFADSKTFVDCVPRRDPKTILDDYRRAKSVAQFRLAEFVHTNFQAPVVHASHYVSPPRQSLPDHIDGLWPVLTRQPEEHPGRSSLLPLPGSYVVPGGRFGEMYYWDSYFTMLGLTSSGQAGLVQSMVQNFAYLIDTYGHIPNGTRTYYLSRSQPPVFALMVELYARHCPGDARRFLPQLRKEYHYWMDGAELLRPGEHRRHVVCLPDGALLNRYWDDRDTPREESYIEDVTTAQNSRRPVHDVYRDLRAAAASGWDFSTRWLDTAGDLSSIRTTAILPVDLNAFLYKLETTIAHWCQQAGDSDGCADFRRRAEARARAIQSVLWDSNRGAFMDYDWVEARRREGLNAAALVPLYVGLATPEQAERSARTVRGELLLEGGLATTLSAAGEQWDPPNGWPPLQWMAARGLSRYGIEDLAGEIANRWLNTVSALYRRENKLVEKYVLHTDEGVGGGGGEYPLQDGFGWTNGVVRKLLELYAEHPATQALAGG